MKIDQLLMKTTLMACVTATCLWGSECGHALETATTSPDPAQRVDPARLMANLEALPTQRAALGDIAHQLGLVATEDLLIERLKAMGHEPVLHAISWNLQQQETQEMEREKLGKPRRPLPETISELASRTWHNIIVDLPGTDFPEQVLIIGAHFDAVPGSPGADDNGSGTAALLELAHVLKDVPMKRTVRLIFFNLEEIGLLGSVDYVRDHHERFQLGKEQVIGMVSLEMLGYFSDEEGSQRSPVPAIPDVFDPPTIGNFIAIATIQQYQEFSQLLGREMSRAAPTLQVVNADFFPVAPPDLMRSDHAPFMKAGIPAVMLTDTAEFRNPHYHKASDTVDTLDHERYTLVVRAVAGAVHAIATMVD
jgi:Zn-dependent M28 family amino/carboxypeptidase